MERDRSSYAWANLRIFPASGSDVPWSWGCTYGWNRSGVPHAVLLGSGTVIPLIGESPETRIREALLEAASVLRLG